MTEDACGMARRYWEAVAAGDWETVNAMATDAVARLRAEADGEERKGEQIGPKALRSEARDIERGVVAPYPKPAGSLPL